MASVVRTLTRSCNLMAFVVPILSAFSSRAQPVQGWYVTGLGGGSFNQDQTVRQNSLFPNGKDRYKIGTILSGSIGWGLNNGFRVELQGDWRKNYLEAFRTSGFSSTVGGHQISYSMMANAYFDMDINNRWIFPYFGFGIGHTGSILNTHIQGTDRNFYETLSGTYNAFTYQAMFGLSFPVPRAPGLSVLAEYRFWTILGDQKHKSESWGIVGGGYDTVKPYGYASGYRGTRTDFNHSLMLGLRYEFNTAAPPIHKTSLSAHTSASAPALIRNFFVYFNSDSNKLTNTARSTIQKAAESSASAHVTRLQISGYSDASSLPSQEDNMRNQKLFLKRAMAVKEELIQNHISDHDIVVRTYDDTHVAIEIVLNIHKHKNRYPEILL